MLAKWRAMRAFRKLLDDPDLVMWLMGVSAVARRVYERSRYDQSTCEILAELEDALHPVSEAHTEESKRAQADVR